MKNKHEIFKKSLIFVAKIFDDTTIAGVLSVMIGINSLVSKTHNIPLYITEHYFPIEILAFFLVIFGVQLIINSYHHSAIPVVIFSLPLIVYFYLQLVHHVNELSSYAFLYMAIDVSVVLFLLNSWVRISLFNYLKNNYVESSDDV